MRGRTIALLVLLLVPGCASFRSGELETAPWPPPSSWGKCDITLHFDGNLAGPLLARFQRETVRAYRDSGLFSRVQTEAPAPPGSLVAEIDVLHRGEANARWATLTGLSLYLVPSWASDHYRVATTFRDAGGRVLARTEGRQQVRLVQQLLLVLAAPFSSSDDAAFYELGRHSLVRAAGARVFAYSLDY